MDRYAEMQVFVRAAEDRSFTAAARNLALTPSAVSKMIARLEDPLGVILFRRVHRNIMMTREGEAYYRASLAAIEVWKPQTPQFLLVPWRRKRCGSDQCRSSRRQHLLRDFQNSADVIRICVLRSSCVSIPEIFSMTAWTWRSM